jgi:hypothetical protein
MSQRLQPRIGGRRLRDLAEQLLDDRDHPFRVEQMHGLGQRSQRRLRASQFATHRRQATCPLQIAEGFKRRIEESQKDQAADLIKEQAAIARTIPFALRGPQAFQQRLKPPEKLQALNRLHRFCTARGIRHSSSLSVWQEIL